MAAKKRGLGPSNWNRYSDIPDLTPTAGRVPSTELDETRGGIRSLIPSYEPDYNNPSADTSSWKFNNADWGPYVLQRAGQYYQGPRRSTRVQAHQFIAIDPQEEDDAQNGTLGAQFYWNIRGYIYVRFWKSGTKGNLWRYGPCTLQDYRVFRESSSKGRSVVGLEALGHGATTEAVAGGRLQI